MSDRIKARLLLKEIRKSLGQLWDTPLPSHIQESLRFGCAGLSKLSEIAVTKPHFTFSADTVEVNIFGDASENACGAVCFRRAQKPGKSIEVAFLFGKARVASIKQLSIPKMELHVAVFCTSYSVSTKKSHRAR